MHEKLAHLIVVIEDETHLTPPPRKYSIRNFIPVFQVKEWFSMILADKSIESFQNVCLLDFHRFADAGTMVFQHNEPIIKFDSSGEEHDSDIDNMFNYRCEIGGTDTEVVTYDHRFSTDENGQRVLRSNDLDLLLFAYDVVVISMRLNDTNKALKEYVLNLADKVVLINGEIDNMLNIFSVENSESLRNKSESVNLSPHDDADAIRSFDYGRLLPVSDS